jgi:hypothetical protein
MNTAIKSVEKGHGPALPSSRAQAEGSEAEGPISADSILKTCPFTGEALTPVFCPHCGIMSYIETAKLRNPPNKPNTRDLPDHSSADWFCSECGLWVTEDDEVQAI